MMAAGLVARKARQRGLKVKPWVRTSLAPGSRVVTEYYEATGLQDDLNAMGFHTVVTVAPPALETLVHWTIPSKPLLTKPPYRRFGSLRNRNFEGRVHGKVKASYLASPPLVVAYAIAGNLDVDLTTEPIGHDAEGKPVMLSEIWPSEDEVNEAMKVITPEMFRQRYADAMNEPRWNSIPAEPSPSIRGLTPQPTFVSPPSSAVFLQHPTPSSRLKAQRCSSSSEIPSPPTTSRQQVLPRQRASRSVVG